MKAPERPEELASHATISMVRSGPVQWNLRGPDGEQVTVPIEPRFQSNNMVTLKEAACANLGVAALPGYICRAELQAGALLQILPEWIAADARISALMPYRTGLLPAVRSLVDYLAVEIPKVTAFDPG
jgi:DNA-binding transcriptional LysR family regulator